MSSGYDNDVYSMRRLTRKDEAQQNKPAFGVSGPQRAPPVLVHNPPPDHYNDGLGGIGSRFVRKDQLDEMKKFVTQKSKCSETYYVKAKGMITQHAQTMAIDKM